MRQYFIPGVLAVFLAGCGGQKDFTTATGAFSAAIAPTVEAYSLFLDKVNSAESEKIFDMAEYNSNLPLDPVTLGSAKDIFTPENMNARMEAIGSLVAYSEALAAAADASYAEDFISKTISAKDAFVKLSKTLEGINNTPSQNNNNEKIIGIVSGLVGSFGEEIIKRKQESAIKEAILSAGRNVSDLISAMKEDLRIGMPVLKGDSARDFAGKIGLYNELINKTTFTNEQRLKMLAEIRASYSVFRQGPRLIQQLEGLLGSLDRSNLALIKLASAKEDEKRMALADAVSVIRQLTLQADVIIAALKSTP